MQTDFSGNGASSWRKKNYPGSNVTTADGMAGANFNLLWGNPKSDDGSTDLQTAVRVAMRIDAPQARAGDEFQAACVAWRYLATLAGSAAAFGTTKQANVVSVAKQITRDAGAALINVYQGTDPQGDNPQKNSVGIGQDWLAPYITVKSKVLQVGVPPKKSADDKRAKFTLKY